MRCLHAVTDEDVHFLEHEDESGRRSCEYSGKIFEVRLESERHHCQKTLLRYVQTADGDIQCQIDRDEFDEIMATKKSICSSSRWGSVQPL